MCALEFSTWTAAEWSAFGQVFSGLGTLAGAIAVGVAAWWGRRTFDDWRQQHLSARHIEEAETVLTATYKVRRSLRNIRQPLLMAYELHMAKERLKENGVVPATESELNKLATAQVYFTRIENESENREALLRCQPMARAIFGEEVERAMDTLLQQFRMLQVSASSQLHFSNETEPAFRKNIEANLWEGAYDDDDKSMTKTIAAQITTIEKICLPVVRLSGQK